MYPPDVELDAALCSLPREALHLYPFDPGDAEECRYWRACELCLYLVHRFDHPPDPRSLSSDDIEDWSRRGLMPDESLSDPTCLRCHRPYWLNLQDERVGILAVHVRDNGWGPPALWLAVAGWPLIRSRQDWERRGHWCDVGWPEGLAQRIRQYEAETRHYGFPVGTPSIPGLPLLTTTPRILE